MMRRKESQPTHLGWADTSRYTSSFHLEEENESKGDDSKKASDIFAVQLKPVRCSNSVDGFIFLSFRKKIIATYAFLEIISPLRCVSWTGTGATRQGTFKVSREVDSQI